MFKDIKEDVQQKIRWIPSWKKRKIAKIAKATGIAAAVIVVLLVGITTVRTLIHNNFSLLEQFQIASSRFDQNTDDTTEPTDFRSMTQITGVTATATSFLVGTKLSYGPENAIDGDLMTSWQEGVSGYGKGESIRFDFSKKQDVACMLIYGGAFKSQDSFWENGRLKTFLLQFSDGAAYSYEADDSFEPMAIYFDEPISTSYVILILDEAFQGNKYEDMVIAEVVFFKN